MKALQISKLGGDFEALERPIPKPGRGQVRIKVEACGICHSDFLLKDGFWPGLQYPRVPGHEIAGRVDAHATQWKPGQRVGSAGTEDTASSASPAVGEILFYADLRRLPASTSTVARRNTWWLRPRQSPPMPDELPADQAAPLLGAGITVCNCATRVRGRATWRGIGGLGHLGIPYARQMGVRTVGRRCGQRAAGA
jgi:D-arabinose 1-dehydrogenase-like Zn-dependent alcohol dehydrogenase